MRVRVLVAAPASTPVPAERLTFKILRSSTKRLASTAALASTPVLAARSRSNDSRVLTTPENPRCATRRRRKNIVKNRLTTFCSQAVFLFHRVLSERETRVISPRAVGEIDNAKSHSRNDLRDLTIRREGVSFHRPCEGRGGGAARRRRVGRRIRTSGLGRPSPGSYRGTSLRRRRRRRCVGDIPSLGGAFERHGRFRHIIGVDRTLIAFRRFLSRIDRWRFHGRFDGIETAVSACNFLDRKSVV